MRNKSLNRMAKPVFDRTPIMVEPVPVDPVPMVRPCPQCGCHRFRTWERRSNGRGEPYFFCRGCGSKYRDTKLGLVRVG